MLICIEPPRTFAQEPPGSVASCFTGRGLAAFPSARPSVRQSPPEGSSLGVTPPCSPHASPPLSSPGVGTALRSGCPGPDVMATLRPLGRLCAPRFPGTGGAAAPRSGAAGAALAVGPAPPFAEVAPRCLWFGRGPPLVWEGPAAGVAMSVSISVCVLARAVPLRSRPPSRARDAPSLRRWWGASGLLPAPSALGVCGPACGSPLLPPRVLLAPRPPSVLGDSAALGAASRHCPQRGAEFRFRGCRSRVLLEVHGATVCGCSRPFSCRVSRGITPPSVSASGSEAAALRGPVGRARASPRFRVLRCQSVLQSLLVGLSGRSPRHGHLLLFVPGRLRWVADVLTLGFSGSDGSVPWGSSQRCGQASGEGFGPSRSASVVRCRLEQDLPPGSMRVASGESSVPRLCKCGRCLLGRTRSLKPRDCHKLKMETVIGTWFQ